MNIAINISYVIFTLSIIIQIFYCFYFFIRLIFYKENSSSFNEPVSIIICAKDEVENLSRNLPSFLNQKYPKFEIIVVDDQSTDGTRFLLNDYEKRYQNFRVVTIDESVNSKIGKKFALAIGIKTAMYDYVLLSDADCVVQSENWITKMTSSFVDKDIVLGISPYKKETGFLNKLIRFDEFITILQYLSFALAKTTYMGVGRNLAYKKSLFFSVKGFASHIHIPSGDDDLFIKEVANRNNVAIQIDEGADVVSIPKKIFKDWLYQRKRHVSTSKYYRDKHKILLFLFPFSQFLFWTSSIFLFIIYYFFSIDLLEFIIFCSLFSLRIILFYFIYFKIMKKLRQLDLLWFYPVMEFVFLFVQLFFFFF